MSVERKVIVVTGASRGIGRATCETLAARGALVVAGSRRNVEGGEANPPPSLDVIDDASVARFFAWVRAAHGRLDGLVLNAGIGAFGRVGDLTGADFQRVLETNLVGAYRCLAAALPDLRRSKGRVVAIGSVADRVALPGGAAYSASKYGLRALVETTNAEDAGEAVLATLVSPGAVATDIWRDRPGYSTGEMLMPEDVAEVVADVLAKHARVRIDEVRVLPRRGIL